MKKSSAIDEKIIHSIFTLIGITAFSQSDTSFQLLKVVKGDIVDFTVDNLDNIYVLNSRNQIRKYNANGDSVAIFNDVKKFGKATLVDVSNPLKVVLFYKDFATVVMLDRFLNVVNTIDLRKQNIFQARAIAQSYDNKIWVYDELENKLKRLTKMENCCKKLQTSGYCSTELLHQQKYLTRINMFTSTIQQMV